MYQNNSSLRCFVYAVCIAINYNCGICSGVANRKTVIWNQCVENFVIRNCNTQLIRNYNEFAYIFLEIHFYYKIFPNFYYCIMLLKYSTFMTTPFQTTPAEKEGVVKLWHFSKFQVYTSRYIVARKMCCILICNMLLWPKISNT